MKSLQYLDPAIRTGMQNIYHSCKLYAGQYLTTLPAVEYL